MSKNQDTSLPPGTYGPEHAVNAVPEPLPIGTRITKIKGHRFPGTIVSLRRRG